jgi:hypothetical protein
MAKTRTPRKKAEGLGDTVENVLKLTGISKLVNFVAGEDCGCDARKEKLNKLFPYTKALCLTEDEYNVLDVYFKKNSMTVTTEEQKQLLAIYNRIFSQRNQMSTCSSCLRDLVSKLKTVYNEYQEDANS